MTAGPTTSAPTVRAGRHQTCAFAAPAGPITGRAPRPGSPASGSKAGRSAQLSAAAPTASALTVTASTGSVGRAKPLRSACSRWNLSHSPSHDSPSVYGTEVSWAWPR